MVGLGSFEALRVRAVGSGSGGGAAVPMEDSGGGADGRRRPVVVAEVGDDFARAPAVLISDSKDGVFQSSGGPGGRMCGLAGSVVQRFLGVEAGQPLVSGLAGNPEVAAGGSDGSLGGANGVGERSAKFGHG